MEEKQTSLGVTLTGFQRFQLTKHWIKNGKQGDKEQYIKDVCKAKGLIYIPPVKIERRR